MEMLIRVTALGLAAQLVWASAPAFADCTEDLEALGLAAQQAAGGELPVPLGVKDSEEQTPAVVGRSRYDADVQSMMREAAAALNAGDEAQCLRMIESIGKRLR